MTQSGSATTAMRSPVPGVAPLADDINVARAGRRAGGEDIVPLTIFRPASRWLGSDPDRFR